MSPVEGVGAWIRNPDAGGDGSGTWRGAQLYRSGGDVFFTGAFAVPFQTADFQSDPIRSTGANVFGAITVPAGAAGVVPADMAGLWRITGRVNAQWDSTDWIIVQYGFRINDVSGPVSNTVQLADPPGTSAGVMFPLDVPPILVSLAAGDVVWFYIATSIQIQIHGGDGTILRNTWMLMEYLRPLPLDEDGGPH